MVDPAWCSWERRNSLLAYRIRSRWRQCTCSGEKEETAAWQKKRIKYTVTRSSRKDINKTWRGFDLSGIVYIRCAICQPRPIGQHRRVLRYICCLLIVHAGRIIRHHHVCFLVWSFHFLRFRMPGILGSHVLTLLVSSQQKDMQQI